MAKDINEKTNVPLFAVLCALPFVCGGILWLTSIDAKASYAKEQVGTIAARIIDLVDMVRDTRERVIRIEEWQKDRQDKQH